MNTEKVIDKVKKLLAIADRAANPCDHEAELALLKAQELLAKNGLSMSDISDKPTAKDVIERLTTDFSKTMWWSKIPHNIIAKNFRCTSFILKRGIGKTALGFIGLNDDVELAETVFKYAQKFCEYQADYYTLRHKTTNRTATKNDFIRGFINGLDTKYKEQVDNNNWGLVLVQDQAVKDYCEEHLTGKKEKVGAVSSARDSEAKHAGYSSGYNFNAPSGELGAK